MRTVPTTETRMAAADIAMTAGPIQDGWLSAPVDPRRRSRTITPEAVMKIGRANQGMVSPSSACSSVSSLSSVFSWSDSPLPCPSNANTKAEAVRATTIQPMCSRALADTAMTMVPIAARGTSTTAACTISGWAGRPKSVSSSDSREPAPRPEVDAGYEVPISPDLGRTLPSLGSERANRSKSDPTGVGRSGQPGPGTPNAQMSIRAKSGRRKEGAGCGGDHRLRLARVCRAAPRRHRSQRGTLPGVFDQSPLGGLILDGGLRILQSNLAIQRLLGRRADELIGQDALAFAHPEDREEVRREVVRLFTGDVDEFQLATRCLQASGEAVSVRLTASLVRDEVGNPLYGIALVEDITATVEASLAIRA